jgi:hypothetical protein
MGLKLIIVYLISCSFSVKTEELDVTVDALRGLVNAK